MYVRHAKASTCSLHSTCQVPSSSASHRTNNARASHTPPRPSSPLLAAACPSQHVARARFNTSQQRQKTAARKQAGSSGDLDLPIPDARKANQQRGFTAEGGGEGESDFFFGGGGGAVVGSKERGADGRYHDGSDGGGEGRDDGDEYGDGGSDGGFDEYGGSDGDGAAFFKVCG